MKSLTRLKLPRLAHLFDKWANARTRITVRLSAPVLALGAALLLLTVGWAFFMGFLVGKGENPGEKLARFDPFVKEEQAPLEAKATPSKEMDEPKEVVAQEFVGSTRAEVGEPQERENKAPAHPFTRPKGQSMAAWGEDLPANQAKKEKPKESVKEQVKEQPKDPDAKRFDYVIRLASFTKKEEAEALNKKLERQGVRGNVLSAGKHWVVQVQKRLSEEEYGEFLGIMRKIRVNKPLVLSKKAVAGGNTSNKSAKR